jgi:DNA-binding FadR family transcriptional regulator
MRRTEAQVALLRAAIPGETGGLQTGEIFAVNRSFHQLLLEAAGNRMLSIVTEPLFSVLQRRFLRDRAEPTFWEEVAADHRRILAAVERRDPDRAEREMARHLKHLRRTYQEIDRTANKED